MVIYLGGIRTHNEPFAYRAEYDADDQVVREGWAKTGTLTSVAEWQICEHTWSGGNMTATKWPRLNAGETGSGAFSFEWDERDEYTYL